MARLGVDLFYSQCHLSRQSLTLLFISVLCGGYINPDSLQYHQSSEHLWISNSPSPPAVLATVSGEIELGLSFVGMFHCLLRLGEWREVTWMDIHIFEKSQTSRYPNVFGILGVRSPKTRRQQVHAKVQHVLVECPGLARLLKALQLRAQVSGDVSLFSGSGAQHVADFQAVLRRLGLVNSPFTLAGFRGGGATDCFLRCRDAPACIDGRDGLRYVQEGVVAELSDLAPQVFHETATASHARLPPQHRRPTSGKGSGGSCLSRHRAQWAEGNLNCALDPSHNTLTLIPE